MATDVQKYPFRGNSQAARSQEFEYFNSRQRKPFGLCPVFCFFLPGKQKPLQMTRPPLLLPLLLLLLPSSVLRLSAQLTAPPEPRLLNLEGLVNVTPDARLYEAFDSVYIENLRTANPTLLLRWNYYLDNAFIVSDFPAQKGEIGQFPVVQIPDLSNFNILILERTQRLARDWDKTTFYRISATNKVLMYYSGKDFNRRFREWLEKS